MSQPLLSAGPARRRFSALVSVSALFAALVCSSTALAQPAPEAPAVAPKKSTEKPRGQHALDLAKEGVKLFRDKRYDDALARFQAAEALVHSPVFLLYQARSWREKGLLLKARTLFRQVAGEALDQAAPAAWKRAQTQATAEGRTLDSRLAVVKVAVQNAGANTRASLDGNAATLAELKQGVQVLPGKHQLVVQDGSQRLSSTIEVEAGASGERALVLKEVGNGATKPKPPVTKLAPSEGSVVPGAVTLGVAGALGIAGGILGGLALSQAAAVRDACNGKTNCSEQRSERDNAIAIGNASTALLAVAGAAAVVGVVLLAVRPGGEDAPLEATLRVTPGGLRFSGRF